MKNKLPIQMFTLLAIGMVMMGCNKEVSKDESKDLSKDVLSAKAVVGDADTTRKPDSTIATLDERFCPGPPNEEWPVNVDSVATFSTSQTIGEMKKMCPAAFDTVMNGDHTTYPALAFPFRGLTVIAGQWLINEADPDFVVLPPLKMNKKPDGFRVSGHAGRLPKGLKTNATLREMVRTFGVPTAGNAEASRNYFGVFKSLRYFEVEFDYALDDGLGSGRIEDIPSDARIVAVEF